MLVSRNQMGITNKTYAPSSFSILKKSTKKISISKKRILKIFAKYLCYYCFVYNKRKYVEKKHPNKGFKMPIRTV
jgi:hypothetical protein